jgi:hypothetical protein
MTALNLHPACACYPAVPEGELEALARDITEQGLLDPITVMPDGAILDGRNRALACARAGVPLRTVVYDGNDPIRFVLSKNSRRRRLTKGQIAMIGARLAKLQHGTNQYQKNWSQNILTSLF